MDLGRPTPKRPGRRKFSTKSLDANRSSPFRVGQYTSFTVLSGVSIP